jgi:membrane-associated protein
VQRPSAGGRQFLRGEGQLAAGGIAHRWEPAARGRFPDGGAGALFGYYLGFCRPDCVRAGGRSAYPERERTPRMDFLRSAVDFVLKLDKNLSAIAADYGVWTYPLLFAIIFAETGFVVTPFLPGDSLLFAAGTIARIGSLDILLMFFLLASAAILGDSVNYWMGHRIGVKAFDGRFRFLTKKHLKQTEDFFARHGGSAVILARFVPFMRTFVPFVAGIGSMTYGRFIVYNVTGGIAWVALLMGAGYIFGGFQIVKDHFSIVILAIIVISVLPVIIEILRDRARSKSEGAPTAEDK